MPALYVKRKEKEEEEENLHVILLFKTILISDAFLQALNSVFRGD